MANRNGSATAFLSTAKTVPLDGLSSLEDVGPKTRLSESLQATLHAANEAALSQMRAGGKQATPSEAPRQLTSRTTILNQHGVEDGTELRPRFNEMGTLGQGAMGEVLLARDNDICRDVAIKRLLPERDGPAYQAAFAGEVRTIGALDHPNIVPVYDVDVDQQGRKFVVMKRVQGQTLDDVIEGLRRGDQEYIDRFPVEKRAGIIIELLRGLACAHNQGILHRDVKPENIMIGPMNEVTLMDWGIATTLDELRNSNQDGLAGTPMYMSPEQARGELKAMDQRSDLYSCCAVFFELCTLEPVVEHPEASVLQVLAQVASGHTTSLRGAWARLAAKTFAPWGYCHILVKGLSLAPKDRYGSAEELLAEIAQERDGDGKALCPATWQARFVRRLARKINKRPRVSMWVAMCILGTWVAAVVVLAMRLT